MGLSAVLLGFPSRTGLCWAGSRTLASEADLRMRGPDFRLERRNRLGVADWLWLPGV